MMGALIEGLARGRGAGGQDAAQLSAPVQLPQYNTNMNVAPNYWQGNQLMIPGLMQGGLGQMMQRQILPPMQGLEGLKPRRGQRLMRDGELGALPTSPLLASLAKIR